ncbi:glycosyltransferase family 39 protein [Crocosphaera subtropica]|uniref:glycosyltransferase family 39 protein n=1 Tax=Crocosphaera subtropica TaxID=2546360 RepID=UPI0003259FE2|nr:glycosyltransferase family 39 protein [Crocosphaera subtropica]
MKLKSLMFPLIPHEKNERRQWFLFGCILLLAVALYIYKIDSKGLWIDEFISLIDAEKLRMKDGRFLYYPTLAFWMTFSNSDAWLRGLSVIFALGSVVLIYELGRYLFNETTGLVAALMLTVSPLFINHAQEVRYYTLATCITLAGTLFLAHALQQPNNWKTKAGWAVMRFLAILTVPFNGALLGADLFLIGTQFSQQKQKLLAFAKPFIGLIILCIPIAIDLISTVTSGKHHLVGPTPGIREVFRELRILTAYSYPPPPPYLTRFLQVYILLVIAVMVIAIIKKPRSQQTLWVAAWGFIPLTIIFVYSHLSNSIWITRYFMFIAPYLLLLLAVGFLKIWRQWRAMAIIVALVYGIAVSIGLTHYYSSPARYMGARGDFYRGVAQLINAEEKPGDVIIWSIIHGTSKPLEHYHRGSASIIKKDYQYKFDEANIKEWLNSLPPIESRMWIVYPNQSKLFCQLLQEKYNNVKNYKKFGQCSVSLINPES